MLAPAPGAPVRELDREAANPTTNDGEHDRMTHIVLEGFRSRKQDEKFVSAGPSVVEGIVNATPVRALCGKIWVPGRDPKRYPLCATCREVAEGLRWHVPAG
ncbi:MAG: DUF3039 domain-containing protein [Acidimicrobiales bacterium]